MTHNTSNGEEDKDTLIVSYDKVNSTPSTVSFIELDEIEFESKKYVVRWKERPMGHHEKVFCT